MKRISFTTLFILVFCFTTPAQSQLAGRISTLQKAPALQHASISICIADARTGEKLACTATQLSLVPASTLKLVTTATALELFGPEHRFETQLHMQGRLDEQTGTFYGNIIIKGGGDPALGSSYFEAHYGNFIADWINALKEQGIETIEGAVLYDASMFDDELVPSTWIWEDLGNYYGAGASGLSVFDNMYKIHFSTPSQANEPASITQVEPEIPGLKVKNLVVSSDSSSDQAYIFGSPYSNNRTVRGTLPKNRKDYVVKGSTPNPPLFLANYFTQQLRENGIETENTPAMQTTEKQIFIYKTTSPPLIEIITQLNFESINMYAEHLVKHIGHKVYGNGSTKAGTKAMVKFWQGKGIDTSGMFIADGSGLSRFNAITAEQLTGILLYMKNQSPYSRQFFETLPLAGREGTLKYYFNKNHYNGTIRAKSGSMTRVRCMTGSYKKGDREYLFSILINNYQGQPSEIIQLMENFILTF